VYNNFLEPPHIADIKDVLVDIDTLDNVTLTLSCSFAGYPVPIVYWMRMLKDGRSVIDQYFNDSTIIIGNIAILSLSNIMSHFGSYQCIAVNEAGYVSRTARILPKGKSTTDTL